MRIHRKRRQTGTKKWTTETVYAATDLPAHQASATELAAWARAHRVIENTVHWTQDVTFAEDASQIRRHRTPAVMSVLRDLARATLHPTGWTNRRRPTCPHPHPPRNHPHTPRNSVIKPDERDSPLGSRHRATAGVGVARQGNLARRVEGQHASASAQEDNWE